MINDLQSELHKQSADAGWWKEHKPLDSEYDAFRISQLHFVISDALDVIRKGGMVDGDALLDNLRVVLLQDSEDLERIPDDQIILGTKLALLHSEVSEAFGGLTTGDMDKHLPHRSEVEVEMADALIRLLDFTGRQGFDLEATIKEKQEYNRTRADHQGENRSATGGKQF